MISMVMEWLGFGISLVITTAPHHSCLHSPCDDDIHGDGMARLRHLSCNNHGSPHKVTHSLGGDDGRDGGMPQDLPQGLLTSCLYCQHYLFQPQHQVLETFCNICIHENIHNLWRGVYDSGGKLLDQLQAQHLFSHSNNLHHILHHHDLCSGGLCSDVHLHQARLQAQVQALPEQDREEQLQEARRLADPDKCVQRFQPCQI